MTRFKIYPVRQRWRKGWPLAWLVNYGEPDEKGKWRRKQTMFSTQARAEEFLELVKREILVEGEIRFGKDPVLRRDAMRAAKLVSEAGLPSGSLTAAVQLLKECRSSQEKRGGGFQEPRDRKVELSPRSYLGLAQAGEGKIFASARAADLSVTRDKVGHGSNGLDGDRGSMRDGLDRIASTEQIDGVAIKVRVLLDESAKREWVIALKG